MADEFPIFGQLNPLAPLGKEKNSSKAPLDKERSRKKRDKRTDAGLSPDLDQEKEITEDAPSTPHAGKVVDIII